MKTAFDVIARSLSMHPTLFAEACEASAMEDRRYVASRPEMDASAKRGAENRASGLERAAKIARTINFDECLDGAERIVNAGMACWLPAHGIACKLQCLPAHVRTQTAVALQEEIEA